MAIQIAGHKCLVFIYPLGEVTIMVCFKKVMGRFYFAINMDAIKEYDAS
jgi:hypothetical protein